jgi:hypothetical protein
MEQAAKNKQFARCAELQKKLEELQEVRKKCERRLERVGAV